MIMKQSITILLSGLLTLSAAPVFAQAGLTYYTAYDSKGQVMGKSEYVDVQGTPYLSSEWLTGTFSLANGKSYSDLNIRYDLVKDKMYVKGGEDDLIALAEQVKEFTIDFPVSGAVLKRHFKMGYTNIPNTTNSYYFEVLAEGKTQLLKRTSKIVQVSKEYNSATSTKSFEEITKYYLYADGKGSAVKKDKKAILLALGNKQAELESYIKDSKLNLKTDEGFAQLITFYNTL